MGVVMPATIEQRVFSMTAIGVVRTQCIDKFSTPRQPFVADSSPGVIELADGHHFDDALSDLHLFSHIWILFVFDQNAHWRPKVMPPMGSDTKRGVFATRSPHRPNPIGMSVVQLLSVDMAQRMIHVVGIDILDGTPVLDIKPYVPMADIVPHANRGWLPQSTSLDIRATSAAAVTAPQSYQIEFSDPARERLSWWLITTGEDLAPRIIKALATTPEPHAFRRIRKHPDGSLTLGLTGWRVDFTVAGLFVTVSALRCAYKPSHFQQDPALHHHRVFMETFG
jgi:tRNA (adenine37-N6)-methyltransferase